MYICRRGSFTNFGYGGPVDVSHYHPVGLGDSLIIVEMVREHREGAELGSEKPDSHAAVKSSLDLIEQTGTTKLPDLIVSVQRCNQ